jgi:hypothetical protein
MNNKNIHEPQLDSTLTANYCSKNAYEPQPCSALAKKAMMQFIADAEYLLSQTDRCAEYMNMKQLKFALVVLQLTSAYAQLMIDGVKIYVDVKTRLNWLTPFMYDVNYGSHFDVTALSRMQQYQLRIKPLFQLSCEESISLTTEEVISFLLMHENYGFI